MTALPRIYISDHPVLLGRKDFYLALPKTRHYLVIGMVVTIKAPCRDDSPLWMQLIQEAFIAGRPAAVVPQLQNIGMQSWIVLKNRALTSPVQVTGEDKLLAAETAGQHHRILIFCLAGSERVQDLQIRVNVRMLIRNRNNLRLINRPHLSGQYRLFLHPRRDRNPTDPHVLKDRRQVANVIGIPVTEVNGINMVDSPALQIINTGPGGNITGAHRLTPAKIQFSTGIDHHYMPIKGFPNDNTVSLPDIHKVYLTSKRQVDH